MSDLRARVRSVLSGLSTRPRRRLSQNFMVSDSALRAIVAALAPRPGERVIEVGGGLGFLTELIAESGAELTVVEKDKRFCAHLRGRFAGQPNVRIHEGDILEFSFEEYLAGGRAKCVGNVPYQISSPLIEAVQRVGPRWDDALFTFQKDFALRMAARAGEEERSSLGAWLEPHASVECVFQLKRSDFDPPPRVDSTLVRIRFRDKPVYPPEYAGVLRAAIRAGFQKRRKSILNALTLSTMGFSKDTLRSALAASAIPEETRASALDQSAWLRLATSLYKGR